MFRIKKFQKKLRQKNKENIIIKEVKPKGISRAITSDAASNMTAVLVPSVLLAVVPG